VIGIGRIESNTCHGLERRRFMLKAGGVSSCGEGQGSVLTFKWISVDQGLGRPAVSGVFRGW
jgi:hypothetical protein